MRSVRKVHSWKIFFRVTMGSIHCILIFAKPPKVCRTLAIMVIAALTVSKSWLNAAFDRKATNADSNAKQLPITTITMNTVELAVEQATH